jgi:predicted RNase H-like HicB family nuclease
MCDIEYRFTVRPLSDEEGGGWLVEYPDLTGCMSDGETIAEAIANGEDAKLCWIAAMKEAGRPSNTQTSSLPGPVREVLSLPFIDGARFGAVIEALGTLPTEGQVDLVNRLINARGEYLAHRMSACDGESHQGVCRERLREIGSAAGRLLRLIHRDGSDAQPWNLHPAITLALPQLCRLAADRGPDQSWVGALGRLESMLADLEKVGIEAEAVFPRPFPKKHGGRRREGHNPATGLVERLIEIYENSRTRYPESGPVPAYGAPLIQFVRAGLAFAVSPPAEVTDSEGRRHQSSEVRYLETDLAKDSRITDNAIRGIFDRLHRSSRKQALV